MDGTWFLPGEKEKDDERAGFFSLSGVMKLNRINRCGKFTQRFDCQIIHIYWASRGSELKVNPPAS